MGKWAGKARKIKENYKKKFELDKNNYSYKNIAFPAFLPMPPKVIEKKNTNKKICLLHLPQ